MVPRGEDVAKHLSPSVYWMQKFEKLSTLATRTLSEACVTAGSDENTFCGLISLYDDQLLELSQKAFGEMRQKTSDPSRNPPAKTTALPNPLILGISRIHVNAFHFFGIGVSHLSGLIELYQSACRWTQQAAEADQANDWALYSSESYFRYIVLVATIILRISRSHLKTKVDLRSGERAYFTNIKLIKRRSLQTGDVNAQMVTILSQLWHSEYCFKLLDESIDPLRVQTFGRGVMGIAHDCLWAWYRQIQHSGLKEHQADEMPLVLPESNIGTGGNDSTDTAFVGEDYFAALMNGVSSNFPCSSTPWIQDDLFWT